MVKNGLFTAFIAALICGCAANSDNTAGESATPVKVTDVQQAESFWLASKLSKPPYPSSLRENRLAGCARFNVTILTTGATSNITHVESFPHDQFVADAASALKKWHWKPTPSNTLRQPITRTVQIDYYDKSARNIEQAKAFCTRE